MYGKDDQYHSYDPGGSSVKEMMARLMQLQGKITSTISEVTRIDGDVSSIDEKQSQISQTVDEIELEVYEINTTDGSKTSRISSLEIRADGIETNVSALDSDINNTTDGLKKRVTSAESSITQNAEQIALRVEKTTYESDITATGTGLIDRVTSAESSIELNAESITSKVSTTDYKGETLVSMINQTPEEITLSASKVTIGNGSVFEDGYDPSKILPGSTNRIPKSNMLEGWTSWYSSSSIKTETFADGTPAIRLDMDDIVANPRMRLVQSYENLTQLVGGREYTFSFIVKASVKLDKIELLGYRIDSDASYEWVDFPSVDLASLPFYDETEGSRIYSHTFTAPRTCGVRMSMGFGLGNPNVDNDTWFFSGKFQVEEGNVKTDWNPNPDDLIQINKNYNGWKFEKEKGVTIARSDGLVQVLESATDGIKIQRRASTSSAWEDVLYMDTNGNMHITGTLNGVGGTFSGELSTTEKLRVKNPQLSGIGGVSLELETGFLSADGSTYTPNGYVYLDTFNEKFNIGQINSSGTFQQLKRVNIDSEFTEFDGDVNIRGAATADKITLDSIYGKYLDSYMLQDHNNGNVTVNALGATLYLGYINTSNIRAMNDIFIEPGKRIIARGSETGYMGIGTHLAAANTGVIVGTGVNFRAEKNYTPASISISQSSGVLSNSAGLKIADINAHGFWLYIENQTAGLRYWRGTYTG